MPLALASGDVGSARAVELDKECSLTVTPGTHEDLANAQVVIDLYKVADAEAVSGYDTYTFKPTSAYGGMESIKRLEDMTEITNEDYQAVAQEAMALTLKTEGVSVAKTVDGQPADSPIKTDQDGKNLKSGLYLVVARGADLTEVDDYVTSVRTEGEEAATKLATVAHSDTYTYTFEPQLIALPSRMVLGADGTIESNETSNTVDWQYELAVTLKPEQALRFGNLEIIKNIPVYADGEPASFVFRIDAYRDEAKTKTLYSDVRTITFSGAGSQSVLIENKIPVGAYVEVTEEYSGTAYTQQLGEDETAVKTAVIPAPGEAEIRNAASVTFTNIYQGGTTTSGGAITNHFGYNEGGEETRSVEDTGWKWTQQ